MVINLRNVVRIDRKSIFGNPFRVGVDGTRDEVIEKYRIYFKDKVKDPEFLKKVLLLKGKVLACWCKPLPCHGDVIEEYLSSLTI